MAMRESSSSSGSLGSRAPFRGSGSLATAAAASSAASGASMPNLLHPHVPAQSRTELRQMHTAACTPCAPSSAIQPALFGRTGEKYHSMTPCAALFTAGLAAEEQSCTSQTALRTRWTRACPDCPEGMLPKGCSAAGHAPGLLTPGSQTLLPASARLSLADTALAVLQALWLS